VDYDTRADGEVHPGATPCVGLAERGGGSCVKTRIRLPPPLAAPALGAFGALVRTNTGDSGWGDGIRVANFNGSALKLRRARHHFDGLIGLLEGFAASKPYSFVIEPNPAPPNFAMRVHVNHALPDDCGLIVGDFAHNARSALDLLVYELSTLAPADKKRRELQFPIFNEEAQFRQHSSCCLRGVGERERELIEQFQPFQRTDKTSVDTLALLAEVNNTDKHRVISVVAALSSLLSLSDTRGVEFSADAELYLEGCNDQRFGYKGIGDGVLTDGAIVAELRLGPRTHVSLQPNVASVIRFGGVDAVIAGRELIPTLTSILNRAIEVVRRFRGG